MRVSIKSEYNGILIHTLVWAALIILLVYNKDMNNQSIFFKLPVNLSLLYFLINVGLFYFNVFVLHPKFLNKKKWLLYIVSIIISIALVYILQLFILHHFYPETEQLKQGKIFTRIISSVILSMLYSLVRDKLMYEKEQRKRQAEQVAYELKFLRSQINPHFLFNVLTNLVSLARKKSDQLEPSLIMLSDLMRYMLHDSVGKKIPLTDEINYLKSYIELQKLRFGDDIKIISHFDVNGKEESLTIEPMLLIPFVENAFKHGTGWIEDPFIHIRLMTVNNQLMFDIKNKCSETTDTGYPDSGIGLANVSSRLNILYPNTHTLTIDKMDNIFHVQLTISSQ